MDTQLWNLFRETGDPLGYLLYKAGKRQKPEQKEQQKKTQKDGTAPSF